MPAKNKNIFRILRYLLLMALIGGVFSISALAFWATTLKIPDMESFDQRKVAESTKIYDRTGEILLWDVHSNIQRTIIPFEDISANIKNATIAIEDSSFYQHRGISPKSIIRALLIDLQTGSLNQGGSTITQQLVKNTFLTREKSLSRKIKEIVLTLKIEQILGKDDILNLYLNEIPYGGNNYGVETASKNFFGKNARDTTLAEAAYLAALPQAPTYYSPYGSHRDKLKERKNLVLSRMAELEFITEEEKEQAQTEKVVFMKGSDGTIKAPHFSMMAREYLEKEYGQDAVENGGLQVITTLDYGLQQKAEELVKQYAEQNKKKFNASNAGLVAIDPKTGGILAMVGSKDYFNMQDEGNFNVALGHRQPGSSIKPFIYATAFKKGYTPNTVVFDVPTEFTAACNPDGTAGLGINPNDCYMPVNYDNNFRGPIDLRHSLAQSLNVPSVKTLYLAGMKNSLQTLSDMGITSLKDPERYGLTLVLGGGEVSLLEITGGYSVFANNGEKNRVFSIIKIEDIKGEALENHIYNSEQVLDKNIALTITDILSDNAARIPTFAPNSPLYFSDRQVAAKTGTTNDYHDAWIIGYTPNIAVGVWCGNNDNSPMEKKVAGMIAAPLWRAFMDEALKNLPVENFEKPNPMPEPKPVLAGDWQNLGFNQIMPEMPDNNIFTPVQQNQQTKPQVHSILYWLDKDNPLGPSLSNPASDPQFKNWETSVLQWASSHGYNNN